MSGEIKFTHLMCKELEAINAVVIPYVASMRNRPHVPDRIVWHKYWHGLIEFKGVTTDITAGQKIMIRQLNARVPGSAWVVRCAGIGGKSVAGHIEMVTKRGVFIVASFMTALEMINDMKELQERLQNGSLTYEAD